MHTAQTKVTHLLYSIALIFLPGINAVIADAPMVHNGDTLQVTNNVWVIPDKRINLVPNIGIIVGTESIMVVDTGMGPKNAELVIKEVRKISDKPISHLAITHFHPEHGMGAQSFPEETRIVVPLAQKQELADKGEDYIKFFSGMSPEIANLLSDVNIVTPHLAFESRMEIDLGGQVVELYYFHPGHTRGDMFVFLPDQKLLFGGDLIIERFFPIMPDPDASPTGWMASLKKLKALKPEIIIPGHGEVGDVSLIDDLMVYLTALQVQVSGQKKNGVTLEEAQAKLVPQFTRSYSHWDNPEWIEKAIERFYAELK